MACEHQGAPMQRSADESDLAPPPIAAQQWRQIVNGATDTGVIETEPQCRVTSWNTGATRILGWTEAEMLGKDLQRLFTVEDRASGIFTRELRDASHVGRGGGEEGWRVCRDG